MSEKKHVKRTKPKKRTFYRVPFVTLVIVVVFFLAPCPVLKADAVGIPDESLLSYVPADSDLVLSVDFGCLLRLPFVRDVVGNVEESEMKKLRELALKYDLTAAEVFKQVILFADIGDDRSETALFGWLVHTAVEESAFKRIIAAESAQSDLICETTRMGGCEVYLLMNVEGKDSVSTNIFPPALNLPEKIALVYLSSAHVLISKEPYVKEVIEKIDTGETLAVRSAAHLSGIDRESSVVWALYERPASGWFGQAPGGENPLEEIVAATFSLAPTGVDQQDYRTLLTVESGNSGNAQNIFTQSRMIAGRLPDLMRDDPQLGRKLAKSIDIELTGKVVKFTILLEHELVETLREYAGFPDVAPAEDAPNEAAATKPRVEAPEETRGPDTQDAPIPDVGPGEDDTSESVAEKRRVETPKETREPGMYSGTQETPIPAVVGQVVEIVGTEPLELEEAGITVFLERVFYKGHVVEEEFVKPSEGAVGKVTIQGRDLRLKNGDLREGTLNTTDFGPVKIYFQDSPGSEFAFLALTEEQLTKLRKDMLSPATR